MTDNMEVVAAPVVKPVQVKAKSRAALILWIYLLALVGLTVPFTLLCGAKWGGAGKGMSFNVSLDDTLSFYGSGWYYLYLVVLVATLAMLLLVPVRLAQAKSLSRAVMWIPLTAVSFLAGNLVFGGVFSLLCVVLGEKAYEVLDWLIKQFIENPLWNALNAGSIFSRGDTLAQLLGFSCLMGLLSLFAGYVFFLRARADDPPAFIARARKWLLYGSLLELLAALGSHACVRLRGDCCTPIATFWGVAVGLSIWLAAFGLGQFQNIPKPSKPFTE